ncbi:MAG: sigma-70 family RNA polymerase sigma factor [Bacillota bacterium]
MSASVERAGGADRVGRADRASHTRGVDGDDRVDRIDPVCSARAVDAASLARQHAPLVMKIAARFSGRAELADVYQAGCVGLLKAIAGFDPRRGAAFSTYAVPVIVGEIVAYLRGSGPLHVPRTVRQAARACSAAIEALRAELGREPTASEVGRRVGLSAADVVFALESLRPPTSLDAAAALDDPASGALISCLPDAADDPAETACRNVSLRRAISMLPHTQRQVVVLRFFRDLTQAEVARLLGCSQAHVHRLERAALKLLRSALASE